MICEVHSTGAQASSLTAGSSKSGQKRADWRNFEKNYTSQTADEKPWADLRALPAGRLGEKAIYLSAAALELRVESKGAAQRREEKRASDGGANAAHQNHPLSSSWSTKLTLNEVRKCRIWETPRRAHLRTYMMITAALGKYGWRMTTILNNRYHNDLVSNDSAWKYYIMYLYIDLYSLFYLRNAQSAIHDRPFQS